MMSPRLKYFAFSLACLALGTGLIIAINALSIDHGYPLLAAVIVIIISFLLWFTTFIESFRKKPSLSRALSDIIDALIRAF